ncbi:TPA: colanic acid biosynthesis pyruvyl transferase WcaK [Klebsiella pneumoniae]|uniref:colanic acid biosynthesis pyruvyl transferase WcaK n=1 Tax=Klebsiella pneumoniae TaxID=573 RepID=UPI00192B77CE|nr:colanic acid biosynthesis pyruvyl transferase WcaK [Klebsiella pneumoniae]MBL4371553.1 colanic acid biosynthesis pyruvyl transferase WcaK [Klebsiella pneumoniae]MCP6347219.1 colanic acid biosynthesis pyruvyl transferase WcaK [Klebsiella pneumoniae]HBV2640202.1 colanic acid biosynthesis pyruvyl transferase WcaK [Klebsiella pneumoniae]HBV2645958.1 colanic acid biosynthesis pyruvyl transferase WcaK [Klebsiella pneumoniae]HBV3051983.1 colanic acid biosynthesis pyruvyl transferase WcaK [Klebsiel
MKLLLVGNHTCGNRGDGAILRGLLDSFRKIEPSVELDIISRYAISSSLLLDEKISIDKLHLAKSKQKNTNLYGKIKNKINAFLLPRILLAHAQKKGLFFRFSLPSYIVDFISDLKQYDAVIQVGGSFFVDLYGTAQFEHVLCSLIAKKNIYLVGHSVGPFENDFFNEVATYSFSNVNKLILREEVSLELMRSAGIPTDKVIMGVDTAFLVDDNKPQAKNYVLEHWLDIISRKPTIAITVRRLAPFDKRLGVSQESYESAIASLVDYYINEGFQVVAFSTCTGIESYNNDDRMIAYAVSRKLKASASDFHIVMDEINDLQLGYLLKECVLTVGTRLHSAIISINFGTPAVAINYEHKSLGVMRGLGMNQLSADLQELLNGKIIDKINYILENYTELNDNLKVKVNTTRNIGLDISKNILDEIG